MNITCALLDTPSRQHYFIANGQLNAQMLRSVGRLHIHSAAWSQTRTVEEALAVIKRHPDVEPTPEELCDRMLASDYGNWREVVRWAGYLTLKFKLEADMEDEIQLIQQTITIAAMVGLKVIGLIPASEGEGENPPSVMGLSMTVRREGFREELWLETEPLAEPIDQEDFCPEDSEGIHFIGCGCDY